MVNKITSPITPLGEIDKINEIIDELDNIDPLPSQTGQSGKYLTTNGTVPSWADVQSLPSQTGKAGKFLQTDGTDASWESAPFRNIGEIVSSTIPLTDAGLHLLDGALIQGDGIYSAFVDYIADLYNTSSKASNVTKVGSLTDNNGVLSGFSTSNYATLPNSVSLGSNFEICVKVTTATFTSTQQDFISGVGNPFIALGITTGNILNFNIGDGSSWLAPTITDDSISENTTYWFKIIFNGNKYSLLKSTDNESFTEVAYLDSTSTIPNCLIQFGIDRGRTLAFYGSVDLNESYININGQRWWTGVNPSWVTDEVTWQSSVTTYGVCDKFVYDSTNNTVRLPKYGTQIITKTSTLSISTASTVPVRGNGMTLGFTNGYNNYGLAPSDNTENSWAYRDNAYGTTLPRNHGRNGNTPGDGMALGITTDGSKSGMVAVTSGVVTASLTDYPLDCYYYIVLATSTKTDIEVDIDEIASDLNDKVGKNGDSVNGNYYATTDDSFLTVNNTNITNCDGTSTANTYSGIQFNDANGVRYGKLEGVWNTNGYTTFGFNALRRVNGSKVYATVRAWVDANGNTYFEFPKCTTRPTTTSSASANKVAVVVQNYVNGTSWYRVWSDGWCEQGGKVYSPGESGGTVNLLKTYINTNYSILATVNDWSSNYSIGIKDKTVSSFKVYTYSEAKTYYWRTEGYIN